MYVAKEEALANPLRQEILRRVQQEPGIHLQRLADRLGARTSSVLWHVRKLEGADLVRSRNVRGYRIFHAVSGGSSARRQSALAAHLKNANARSIQAAIARHPGASSTQLAAMLGLRPGTVRWHLRNLLAERLVRRFMQGSQATYYDATGGT